MVRTKADSGSRKAVAAKAPRKVSTPSRSSASSDKSSAGRKAGCGGNSTVSRPVPDWQKPISMFFLKKDKESEAESEERTVENEERTVNNKENSTPNVPDTDIQEISDSEEPIQASKKTLGKRRKDDFLDSDDDD